MRESYRLGAVASVAMLAFVMMPASLAADTEGAEWTFMVYLDADNNLEAAGEMNLEWMESIGSTTEVNIVVLMDTFTGLADLLHVNSGGSVSVGEDYGYPYEANMADPAVLEEFIEICCTDYEAEKYALILWDHGGGWRGLCWDDSTPLVDGEEDCITMEELRDALEGAKEDTGEVMDVIGFDLCLMAMPEVAYQVRGYADYVVFSEETVPGAGFPYDLMLGDLVDAPEMDGRAFSEVMVDDYAAYWSEHEAGYLTWTISAFDMACMGEIKSTVDQLGKELIEGLRTYMQYYQMDVYSAQRYYYPYNIDLKGFAENLIKDTFIKDKELKAAAEDVSAAVSNGIIKCANGPNSEGSYGMAIYIPSTNDGMHSLKEDYRDIPFACETSWLEFVEAFSSFHGRTWGLVPTK